MSKQSKIKCSMATTFVEPYRQFTTA